MTIVKPPAQPTMFPLLETEEGYRLNGKTVVDKQGALHQRGEKIKASADEINVLDGAGVTKADLKKLHAIKKTEVQINGVADGATANPQQPAISDLKADADLETVVRTVNLILSALRAAGIIAK